MNDRRVVQALWDTVEAIEEIIRWHEAGKDLDRADHTLNRLKGNIGELLREQMELEPPRFTEAEYLALVARDVAGAEGGPAGEHRTNLESAYRKINTHLMRRGL